MLVGIAVEMVSNDVLDVHAQRDSRVGKFAQHEVGSLDRRLVNVNRVAVDLHRSEEGFRVALEVGALLFDCRTLRLLCSRSFLGWGGFGVHS